MWKAINCHHNYVTREQHFGENVLVTRKGAVRAREGDMGIIPGSMGARSFIVRGKGNPESFMSCSHGAGRAMSRTEAKRRFTVEDHANANGRRRVPQGRGCDRRNAGGLQVDRRGDGSAARSRRDRPHAAPGRLCKGVNGRGMKGPLQQSGCRVAATHMPWEHVHAGSTPAARTILLLE